MIEQCTELDPHNCRDFYLDTSTDGVTAVNQTVENRSVIETLIWIAELLQLRKRNLAWQRTARTNTRRTNANACSLTLTGGQQC